jgi:hypothetical protein
LNGDAPDPSVAGSIPARPANRFQHLASIIASCATAALSGYRRAVERRRALPKREAREDG